MTSLLPRSRGLPDLLHWLEGEWPHSEQHPMRIESYLDNDEFVIRCELPGVDPDKDIHIHVEGQQLKIAAERRREEKTDRHSEFHYGALSRTLLLPQSCDTENIQADYESGILNMRMPVRQAENAKEIPVSRRGK